MRLQQLVHMTRKILVSFIFGQRRVSREHTGGFSSTSSVRDGFALRFAKTPSLVLPVPTILVVVGAKAGYCVTLVSTGALPDVSVVVDLTSRLVLPSSSASPVAEASSSSSSEGESNVSASVRSASEANGSSRDMRRVEDVGDCGRDVNGGGGDEGTIGPSTWS